ncbi:unnamed protein product [Notodromas monacha]|uniref:Uncharacterized protein n=1 Tax=Notodromas monacha TaxID=399045 RepID=A0A7R9GJ09_9CRUS|nr:unnamed protein product [Notodromas monacha]CAG0924389.1 unnamed protein product [Notodromas monacha]
MKTEIPDSGFAKQVCETGHWLHDTLRASILWTTMAGWSLLLLALLSCSRTGGNCAPLGAIINHLMGMHKTLRSMLALVVSLGTVFMLASFFDTLLAISCIVVGVFYATAAAPVTCTRVPERTIQRRKSKIDSLSAAEEEEEEEERCPEGKSKVLRDEPGTRGEKVSDARGCERKSVIRVNDPLACLGITFSSNHSITMATGSLTTN